MIASLTVVLGLILALVALSASTSQARKLLRTTYWARVVTLAVVVMAPVVLVIVWATAVGGGGEYTPVEGGKGFPELSDRANLTDDWDDRPLNAAGDLAPAAGTWVGEVAWCEDDTVRGGAADGEVEDEVGGGVSILPSNQKIPCKPMRKFEKDSNRGTRKPEAVSRQPTTPPPKIFKLRIRRPKHHRQPRERKRNRRRVWDVVDNAYIRSFEKDYYSVSRQRHRRTLLPQPPSSYLSTVSSEPEHTTATETPEVGSNHRVPQNFNTIPGTFIKLQRAYKAHYGQPSTQRLYRAISFTDIPILETPTTGGPPSTEEPHWELSSEPPTADTVPLNATGSAPTRSTQDVSAVRSPQVKQKITFFPECRCANPV